MHINSINAVEKINRNLQKSTQSRFEVPVENPIGQDTVSFQGKLASAKTRNALYTLLALVGSSALLVGCNKDVEKEEAVIVTTEQSQYPGGYTTDNYTVNIQELQRGANRGIGDSIKVGSQYLDEHGNTRYAYNKFVIKGYVPADAVGSTLSASERERYGIPDNASYRILRNGATIKSNPTYYNYTEVNQVVNIHLEYMDSILAELRNMNAQINNMQGQLNDITALLQLMASYLQSMDGKLDSLNANQIAQYNLINSTYADWLAHWTQYTDETRTFRLNLMQNIVQYGDQNDADNAAILNAILGIYPYLNDVNSNLANGFNAILARWDLSDANVMAMLVNIIQHMDLHDQNRSNEAAAILAAIANLHGDVTAIKNATLQILAHMQDFNPELLAKLNTIIANQNTMIGNQNIMDAHQQQGFADVIEAIGNISIPGAGNYDVKLDRIIELLFNNNGLLTQYGNSILNRFDELIPLVRNGFISLNTNLVSYGDATLQELDDLMALLTTMNQNQQAAAAAQIAREDTIIAKLGRMELAQGDIRTLIQNLNLGGAVDLTQIELLLTQILAKETEQNANLAQLNITANDVKAILEAMKQKCIEIGDQAHLDALAILNKIKDPVACGCGDCCERILAFLEQLFRSNEGEGNWGDIFNRD